jgi:GntR family transcriptional repressor for pyruvate dehydrogenase complex
VSIISRQTLTDRVADAVLELIFDQGLAEGDSLPSSGDLAKRFDVSVVVVREALATLAGRGVLLRRQGRESVVAMPGHEVMSSTMRLRAKQALISMGEFLDCRAALEVHAATLAAGALSREEREAQLQPAVDAMRETVRRPQALIDADLDFHTRLAELSGNRALQLILASLRSVIREELERRTRGTSADARRDSVERHAVVADAIVAGDREAAAAAMQAHFEYALKDLPDVPR